MDIREATPDDIPTVRSVARESWLNAYADVLPESVVEDAVSAWYADETMTRIVGDDEQACLVAVDDRSGADEIVGFAHGATDGDEGDLLRLYVHPDRWHEGIGTALLDAMEDRLTEMGADRVQAMVLADNEMGNAFYEDRGFEKVGEAETRLDGPTRTENVYAKAS
ncbi:GNAT family N-acetyltransferase [Halorussus gelatinilyticus]|uniref:GNAT family N-acetyltransferase n=1 Tax=Halorussus gelatinilyticus TaxID=2937524 RepID=A0A8U0IMI3_9EURY|nr:GNAT family N-acetyltransferase [Halorussus gelatinilyticus]UPW01219.1 GNAT family N-acetyltransferase [Halorussus gelatinilyticus]